MINRKNFIPHGPLERIVRLALAAGWLRHFATANCLDTEALELELGLPTVTAFEDDSYVRRKWGNAICVVAAILEREGQPIDIVVMVEVREAHIAAVVET